MLDRAREAGIAELLLVGCINEAAGHRRAIAVAQAERLPGPRRVCIPTTRSWRARRPTTS